MKIEFLDTEILIWTLEGWSVACESEEGAWVGELRRRNVDRNLDLFIVEIWGGDGADQLVGATDIRNFTKITVL
jgi:hypothetical protein